MARPGPRHTSLTGYRPAPQPTWVLFRPVCTVLHGASVGGSKYVRISQSCDADVLWSPKSEHPIEDRGGDRHLGRLTSVGARAKGTTYHVLPPIDVCFDERTEIVARDLLPASATSLSNDS